MIRTRMRRLSVLLGGVLAAGCGVSDALVEGSLVARAAGHRLTVERYAPMLAEAPISLHDTIARQYAHRWIEYTLLAEYLVAGDSLLDSATVLRSMWPEVERELREKYRARQLAERLEVDAATVDSAYRAGDHRHVQQAFARYGGVVSGGAGSSRAGARRDAEALRRRLAAGASWERATDVGRSGNALNVTAGLVARGTVADTIERVVFRLAPGEVSEVVEGPYGFFVLRRPPLEEIREQYRADITAILRDRVNGALDRELLDAWNVDLRPDALADTRKAMRVPLRMRESLAELATYRGGQFTVADFVRRLQAVPGQLHWQMLGADDGTLESFLRQLIRDELLVREARAAGITLEPETLPALRDTLRNEISEVREALRLESVVAGASDETERRRVAQGAVRAHLPRVMGKMFRVAWVPPFLAAELRRREDWHVWEPALQRAVVEAQRLREARDETAGTSRPLENTSSEAERHVG